MTEQLAIDGADSLHAKSMQPPEKPAKPLTGNQQLAWDLIRRTPGGVTADEIGAWIHAHREQRPHPVGERCEWCAKTGRQTATSVALKPLVVYRRGKGIYEPRDSDDRIRHEEARREPTEAELAANPFAGL